MDFYRLVEGEAGKKFTVYPDFNVHKTQDLLIKGGRFYAFWDEENGVWCRDEMRVAELIDNDLRTSELNGDRQYMRSYRSKSWEMWRSFCGSLPDTDIELDPELTFADTPSDRRRYASRRLPYSLVETPCGSWEELISTLYTPVEREKLEWAIGSIVAGDSKVNQKFMVLYGPSGYGKSTILGIMEKLFTGYYIPIDMKALGANGSTFSMAGFKNNPLLAIQHDGDMSRLEDNTKLNSIISHEMMPINEKFKAEYYTRVNAFLILGTNEPVKISNSKSGIIRRLIDVYPSGNLIENRRYHILMSQIEFELGAIANHCLKVYQRMGKNYYSNYRPTNMMYETDVFYNYVEHFYDLFFTHDGVTLERAWALYKEFCEESLIKHKLQRHQFRSEMMNYFEKFDERVKIDDIWQRSYYSGFKTHRFLTKDESKPLALTLDEERSLLDEVLADQLAQYASGAGTPRQKWDSVGTTLSDLDTSLLHYVMVPENHIVIDFDLKDGNGNKSRALNLEAASEWLPTYTELSQGGEGVHLHYIYDGPGVVGDLRTDYREGIEVKTLLGNSSLRRRLTKCNNVGIATITSGLPMKEKPMHDAKAMTSEKAVRKLIIENLRKQHHPGTKPSVEFIKHILDEAYESGVPYDVGELYSDVYSFAMGSSHHARYCIKLVHEMKFASEDMELKVSADDGRLAFFDVEVFPNLFILCWKFAGEDQSMNTMINPSPQEVEEIVRLRLVGFNCRRYDNHIIYAAAMGYSVEQLYDLSQRIISNDRSAYFGAAYQLSYADIFDYSSKKQSLKKFEIELGIHHMELGLPWDEPVSEDQWLLVAEYCANDVVATEATHESRRADFIAREILAELSGLTVNDSTQQHTARIIFGKERKPQRDFIYTELKTLFPGYRYDFGTSTYRGEEVGEGGYVYSEPGHYHNVALLDVASMHPTSIELLDLFGPYTEKFSELKNARMAIKHRDFQQARRMMDGKLAPYLEDEEQADALAYALKIVINTVYGLTSAKFENPFRDVRNKDNIVAKRGALFMLDLKHFVQNELNLQVIHIKTDSIKVPDPTDDQIKAIMDFGNQYGYDFEHEATYPDFYLFNDAVYIAKDEKDEWHATGAQFQHPYVFKKLLSGEEIVFDDLCETRNVAKGEIYIATGEHRRFVGRIGRFVPLIPGSGGGALLRIHEGKEFAVTGTKGYEWLEAELVVKGDLQDKIDFSYFDALAIKADEAMRAIE